MKRASEARPVYDYLRVLLGCVSYLGIDPLVKLLFSFVPEGVGWLLSGIAMAISALISWLVFNLVDLRSTFTFTWADAADGNTFAGEVVDLRVPPSQHGRIVYVQVERVSTTLLSRRVFSWMLANGFVLRFSSNQRELRFTEERGNEAIIVEPNRVTLQIAEPDHASTTVTFDLGLRWDGVIEPELVAHLKYEPQVRGDWWVKLWVALLVKVVPSVKAFRKVQVSV